MAYYGTEGSYGRPSDNQYNNYEIFKDVAYSKNNFKVITVTEPATRQYFSHSTKTMITSGWEVSVQHTESRGLRLSFELKSEADKFYKFCLKQM